MADELEADVTLLFDCMKCQLDCPTALKEALLALASLCNREGQPVKCYIRKCSGLKFISRILTTISVSDVQMAALYALGCAVEHYVYSQQELSTVDLFNTLQQILSTQDQKPGLLRTCCYLMLAVVNNNNLGQALVRDSGCLECLLTLFKKTLPGNLDDAVTSDDKSTSMDLWSTVTSAISVCVNNPRNGDNQRMSALLYPFTLKVLKGCSDLEIIRCAVSLIGSITDNNVHNQDRVAQCGGLSILLNCLYGLVDRLRTDTEVGLLYPSIQALVGCLDAVLTENSENSDKLGRLGIVTVLLHLLRNPSLPTDTRLQVVIALGHCTDTSDKNRLELVKLDGMSTLVQELTQSCNEELTHAIKYVLQTCVSIDAKSATKINVHNSLGRQDITTEFSRKGLSHDNFTVTDTLVNTDNRKFGQDSGLTGSRPEARTDACALSSYHAQITSKLNKLENILERCLVTEHQPCSGSMALSNGLHREMSGRRREAEAEEVWTSAPKANVLLNQMTDTNEDGKTGLCPPANTAKNRQPTRTQHDWLGSSCLQADCSLQTSCQQTESPVCKFIFTNKVQSRQSFHHKRVHQNSTELHSTGTTIEVQGVNEPAKQISLYDSDQSVKSLGLQGVCHSTKNLISGNQCLRHTAYDTRSRSLCDLVINNSQGDDRRNRVSGQCPRRNTILDLQENTQLSHNRQKSAPGIANNGRKLGSVRCINNKRHKEHDISKQTTNQDLSESNVFDKQATTLEPASVGRSEIVPLNGDRGQPAVVNELELDFMSEKKPINWYAMKNISMPRQRKKSACDLLKENEKREQHVQETLSKMSVSPRQVRLRQINTNQSQGTFVKPTRPVPRRAARRGRSAPGPSANSNSHHPSGRRSPRRSVTALRSCVTRTPNPLTDPSPGDTVSISGSCRSLAQSIPSDRRRKEGGLVHLSQPSDVSQTQQRNQSTWASQWKGTLSTGSQCTVSISELADVSTVRGHKKEALKDKCPGCQAPATCQLPILNSRTYNIAIETSCYTCTLHRQLRGQERAFIRQVRRTNPSCGHLPRRTCSIEIHNRTETAKRDVYEYVTDSDSLDEDVAHVTPPHCFDVTPSHSVLSAGSSSRRRPRVPYTDEEVTALLRGVEKKGRRWKDILHSYRFHPSRTAVDLKDKYRRLMAKQAESSIEVKSRSEGCAKPFSMAEIRRLKRGVRLYGHNWKAILHGFRFSHGRTPTELRDKWRSIHRR